MSIELGNPVQRLDERFNNLVGLECALPVDVFPSRLTDVPFGVREYLGNRLSLPPVKIGELELGVHAVALFAKPGAMRAINVFTKGRESQGYAVNTILSVIARAPLSEVMVGTFVGFDRRDPTMPPGGTTLIIGAACPPTQESVSVAKQASIQVARYLGLDTEPSVPKPSEPPKAMVGQRSQTRAAGRPSFAREIYVGTPTDGEAAERLWGMIGVKIAQILAANDALAEQSAG